MCIHNFIPTIYHYYCLAGFYTNGMFAIVGRYIAFISFEIHNRNFRLLYFIIKHCKLHGATSIRIANVKIL